MAESKSAVQYKDNLILLSVKEDPTVSFRIWFSVGSQNDPKGKEGLAMLTAEMLTEGATKSNSLVKILDLLYPMAAGYLSKVDKEMTVISGRVHKDNLKEFYQLFKEAVLSPAFNEDDFNRIKSNMLNYIENDLRYSSDEDLGKAALYGYVFHNTPYGHLTEGSISGLKAITLDDVKDFYKTFYTKEAVHIGLAGAYENDFVAQIKKDFSALPSSPVGKATKIQTENFSGQNFFMIEKECDATAISFGFPINVLRGQDDFFALILFASWFGEHRNSSSHLYQVIREARGLNYGDYAYIETFLDGSSLNMPEPNNARHQQIFEVWIRPVQHIHRHFALRAALRELQNVVDKGIAKEDFEMTKKFLYKYALNYAPTTMRRLGYAIDSKFYGIQDKGDYIEYFRTKIAELTHEKVNKAIRKHIQYKNIKIAVVTQKADEFKKALVDDVPSPVKYATPKPQSVLDEDKIIEKYSLKIIPEKIEIIKIDEMFK
ncbi:MAG: pitrilysin family protein [Bacteroidota bacterium]